MGNNTVYQRTMETVLDNLPTYIYALDWITGEILFANKAILNQCANKSIDDVQNSELYKKISEYCCNCTEVNSRTSVNFEIFLSDPEKWLGIQCSPVKWLDGQDVRLFSCQDITEQKCHDQYVKTAAFTDHLTGLPNRYQFELDMQQLLDNAYETHSHGYLLYVDMDDFKIVNEGYGHDYGDNLLVEFSRFLLSKLKEKKVYRFNSDEFVILLYNEDAQRVFEVLDTYIDRARSPWHVLDHSFYCTLSIGVVRFPNAEDSVRSLVKNADVAMFEAKKMGKNNYLFFNDSMFNATVRRAEVEMMMRDAISRNMDGFTIYYQPYVDSRNKLPVGAEALIRWFSPSGKLIMPDEFIPLSEYLGLIVQLGDFVLRESCRTLKVINDTIDPHFTISVNISMRQLQQSDIILHVESILEETRVNPKNLVFEVTEGMAATEFHRIHLLCDAFRKKGIRIAMDDFGTGYSSLGNMRNMPIDLIKIDQCFIRDLAKDAYSNSFIRLITDLGHSMKKRICIEGVETPEQSQYCMEADADLLQGFYFYRPMSAPKLIELLEILRDRPRQIDLSIVK